MSTKVGDTPEGGITNAQSFEKLHDGLNDAVHVPAGTPPPPLPPTVVKRSGDIEMFDVRKIDRRIRKLANGLAVDVDDLVRTVARDVAQEMTTSEIDTLAGNTACDRVRVHFDYDTLAVRIFVSNLHKDTPKSFSSAMAKMYAFVNKETNEVAPMISRETDAFVRAHAVALDAAIVHERDYNLDVLGFKTAMKMYLYKINNRHVERFQYMWMRVSVGIHGDTSRDQDQVLKDVLDTYERMSSGEFTHATPTLFNSGTTNPNLASCVLLAMRGDSINGIFETLHQCANISKAAAGIGLSIHDIRAKDSYIAGTAGKSNGIAPMLKIFNSAACYVDQGGGKRKGSWSIYLEPWHADVEEFLSLSDIHGATSKTSLDLFFAMWCPDLFFRRVKAGEKWSLFCPREAPGLANLHSAEFEALYERYEREGRARRVMPARELIELMMRVKFASGHPYMLAKDACNRKSNQQNLGTIRSSNLCTEIIQFTSKDEVAVCNLASVNLNHFAHAPEGDKPAWFDFAAMRQTVCVMVRNLNKVIDRTQYAVPEAKTSNMRHRPIGVGVQGLADAFQTMEMAFEDAEAIALNRDIFENIYYAAVWQSQRLAVAHGPYSSFEGSPMSRGVFQFDMWGVKPQCRDLDWESLRQAVMQHGVRNSLLVAPMPTASTSQLLGTNPSFEPFASNLFTRRVLSGDIKVVNKSLTRALIKIDMWDDDMRARILGAQGSIQGIPEIPQRIRDIYKTVWEIKTKTTLDMSAHRGAYICQSQSANMYLSDATIERAVNAHIYAWELGLKTLSYYMHQRAPVEAVQITVDKKRLAVSRSISVSSTATPPVEVVAREHTASSVSTPASVYTPKTPAQFPGRSVAAGREPEEEEPAECLSCGS